MQIAAFWLLEYLQGFFLYIFLFDFFFNGVYPKMFLVHREATSGTLKWNLTSWHHMHFGDKLECVMWYTNKALIYVTEFEGLS